MNDSRKEVYIVKLDLTKETTRVTLSKKGKRKIKKEKNKKPTCQ